MTKPTFITKAKGERSLKRLIHEHLSGTEKARSTKLVHASDLMKQNHEFCAREYALYDITGKKPSDQFLSTAMRTVFGFGWLIQEWVVSTLADAGLAVTDWYCNNCGKAAILCLRPSACSTCGGAKFTPGEHVFQSEVSGVVGSIDTFVRFPGSDPRLVALEIKSIDKEQFKELEAPLAEHRWRTNLYLRLIAESDDPSKADINQDVGMVLYVSKGGFGVKDLKIKEWGLQDHGFSPYKEHFIKRDDKVTQTKVAHAIRLLSYRKGDKGVPLGICPSSVHPRAKQCPVHAECFGLDYKGEE